MQRWEYVSLWYRERSLGGSRGHPRMNFPGPFQEPEEPQEPETPQGWYLGDEHLPDSKSSGATEALNHAGDAGWEVVLKDHSNTYLLKRPKS